MKQLSVPSGPKNTRHAIREADDLLRHGSAGYLAYTLGFGRDEYEDFELPEGAVDEEAKAAWLKGWDKANAQQGEK
jgi:hypothetical protein